MGNSCRETYFNARLIVNITARTLEHEWAIAAEKTYFNVRVNVNITTRSLEHEWSIAAEKQTLMLGSL